MRLGRRLDDLRIVARNGFPGSVGLLFLEKVSLDRLVWVGAIDDQAFVNWDPPAGGPVPLFRMDQDAREARPPLPEVTDGIAYLCEFLDEHGNDGAIL
ncbi:MAG: hypothetical protein M3072_09450 [Candidatus Dormibacteraeota bacterium]|nr:hypothetical protein [Candidatus Dormibacteraeota bacterium]